MVEELKGKFKVANRTYKFTKELDCASSCGIYLAICTVPDCIAVYIGQTVNKFSTRWNAHRSSWINDSIQPKLDPVIAKRAEKYELPTDKTALLDHYRSNHTRLLKTFITNFPITKGFDKSFSVIFVDQTTKGNLDQLEDNWKQKFKSININRCAIITPNVI